MTRQAFVAWLMCASGVALAGAHVLVATQENSQIPPAARNYWAFKLPVQSAVPETATRFDNPIDRFLEKARGEKLVRKEIEAGATASAAFRKYGVL